MYAEGKSYRLALSEPGRVAERRKRAGRCV